MWTSPSSSAESCSPTPARHDTRAPTTGRSPNATSTVTGTSSTASSGSATPRWRCAARCCVAIGTKSAGRSLSNGTTGSGWHPASPPPLSRTSSLAPPRRARRGRKSAAPGEAAVCSATAPRRRVRRSPKRSPPAGRVFWTSASRLKVCGLDNQAIAHILRETADLLEIKDDNPFKIRAYRNGADIASNHPHDLARLDETGLREIPGIGKDLAARIVEIAQTGDTAYHRELVAEFPPTILDLLHLQGVGPKTDRKSA